MRTIGVVSVGRSDYGIYLPILRRISAAPDLRLRLFVSGAHLAPEFGLTVREIEADGFVADERIDMLLSSDAPAGVAKSIGVGTMGFAQAFLKDRPDILLVLGDRFDMLPPVVSALPFKIPVAHIHGGEITEGAIDESIRHAITKLSHLHFVSTVSHGDRVVRMGEEPWRVTVSGAPALDNVLAQPLLGPDALKARFGVNADAPFLLVTYHPATLESHAAGDHAAELLAALKVLAMPVVFTYPNADAGGRAIIEAINAFAAAMPGTVVVPNFGMLGYLSAMKRAACMVGNSSSGIIEAAAFELPVVNVGSRQRHRTRGANVIDVPDHADDIVAGVRRAVSAKFRAELAGLVNPYGDGRAASRIVDRLSTVPLDSRLITKRFHDA